MHKTASCQLLVQHQFSDLIVNAWVVHRSATPLQHTCMLNEDMSRSNFGLSRPSFLLGARFELGRQLPSMFMLPSIVSILRSRHQKRKFSETVKFRRECVEPSLLRSLDGNSDTELLEPLSMFLCCVHASPRCTARSIRSCANNHHRKVGHGGAGRGGGGRGLIGGFVPWPARGLWFC